MIHETAIQSCGSPIVIVGAGHAGVQVAARLAERGWPGGIQIVEGSNSLPYERPPLSKDALKLASNPRFPLLRKEAFYRDNGIELVNGRSATAIDRASQTLQLDNDTSISYRRLILATGSRPRMLSFVNQDLPGVVVVKTIEDARIVRNFLQSGSRVVIIGAGYIGMEVAAAAVEAGCDTLVLETQDRVMNRVTSEPVSRYFESLHREHGARFLFDSNVVAVDDVGNGLAVECADGQVHLADLVVVGIGVQPNQELAAAAGLDCADGVLVDAHSRTSDPFIYAVGDATRFTCPREGVSQRLECVQNAMSQAQAAADSILQLPAGKPDIPWFWTVQHGVRLQTAGIRSTSDESVLRGEPGSGRFAVLYLREGRLAAIDTVHALKDFVAGKKMIAARLQIDPQRAADPEVPLADSRISASSISHNPETEGSEA